MANRGDLRLRTMRNIDAVSPNRQYSARWDTTPGTAGEVDQKLGIVFDREWKRILNANRFYRLAERKPAANAAGKYALVDLTINPSTNIIERMYRILTVIRNNRVLVPTEFDNFPLAIAYNTPIYVWYREGDLLVTLPLMTQGDTTTSFWVNHLPCRIDNLASDADAVTFPDGYEDILCYEAGALLLSKGGAESEAGRELKFLAEDMRQDMLQDIMRLSTQPIMFRYTDSPFDWAG